MSRKGAPAQGGGRPANPLLQRVDALLRRQDDPALNAPDVPVLTEVVEDERARAPAVDPKALEALARELERAVLERLGPEVDRVIEEKLSRTLSGVLGDSRAELTRTVTLMVREAVGASVAKALAPSPASPAPPPADNK